MAQVSKYNGVEAAVKSAEIVNVKHIPGNGTGNGKVGPGQGRVKGSINKVGLEARNFALQFVRSITYRRSLVRRIRNDTLPAAVECMLHHYAYGKPKEQHEHRFPDGVPDLTMMSTLDLAIKAEELAAQAHEAAERETVTVDAAPDGEEAN